MKTVRLTEETEVSLNGTTKTTLQAGDHQLDDFLANILIARGKASEVTFIAVEEKKTGRQAKD